MDFDNTLGTISKINALNCASGTLLFNGNSAIIIPIGNTSQRNSQIASFRFNSDINNFEGFNGITWCNFQHIIETYTEDTTNVVASTVAGNSSVSIGSYNSVSSPNSVAVGFCANATNFGALVHSSGNFSAQGDAQHVNYVLRNTTTSNIATALYLDGVSSEIIIPNNTVVNCNIQVVATRIDITGTYGAWNFLALAKKDLTSSSVTLIRSTKTTLHAPYGWSVKLGVNTVSGALDIKVTGANNQTIRWVASCNSTEVR